MGGLLDILLNQLFITNLKDLSKANEERSNWRI